MKILKGNVTHWDDKKGYGFIRPDDGGNDVFFHHSSISQRYKTPALQDEVSFRLTTDEKGRPCARSVILPGQRHQIGSRAIFTLLALLYLVVLGVFGQSHKVPSWVVYGSFAISLVTFLVYWKDKRAAQADRWRTPETTLQVLALFGGWPGAMIAQQWFRHKTRKVGFQVVFWFTVLLNATLLFLWITESGRNWLITTIKNL